MHPMPECTLDYETTLEEMDCAHRLGYYLPLDGDRALGVMVPQTLGAEDTLYDYITTCPAAAITAGLLVQ